MARPRAQERERERHANDHSRNGNRAKRGNAGIDEDRAAQVREKNPRTPSHAGDPGEQLHDAEEANGSGCARAHAQIRSYLAMRARRHLPSARQRPINE